MPGAAKTISVRLPAELRDRLERLSKATSRSKSWLAVDAIKSYLELQEWQIQEIEAGIREADAGEFATDAEVEAVMSKWGGNAR